MSLDSTLGQAWSLRGERIAVLLLAALAIGCQQNAEETTARQTQKSRITEPQASAFVGSKRCQECHADFYQLWSTSHHGLAMQPYTPQFAQKNLTAQEGEVRIGLRSSGCCERVRMSENGRP